MQYDPASLTPYYDYRDAWMACEASGDFGPCDELPRWINFGLSITEAELRISGAIFETSDFSWSFYVTGECFIENCGRDYSSINIDNGPDFIRQECDSRYGSITEAGLFKDCGEFEYLDGRINGVYVDWYRGDYLHWSEAPMPAPEPGTLALLGLGLAGLGLIQRRRT